MGWWRMLVLWTAVACLALGAAGCHGKDKSALDGFAQAYVGYLDSSPSKAGTEQARAKLAEAAKQAASQGGVDPRIGKLANSAVELVELRAESHAAVDKFKEESWKLLAKSLGEEDLAKKREALDRVDEYKRKFAAVHNPRVDKMRLLEASCRDLLAEIERDIGWKAPEAMKTDLESASKKAPGESKKAD